MFAGLLLANLSCVRTKTDADSPVRVKEGPRFTEISSQLIMGGPEICFNGIDDNQDSLIDEGCGVAQSEVQFVLAWGYDDADFDLYVSDPEGEVAVASGTTASGLTLSADCPHLEKACRGQNYENVYFEDSDILPGVYHVRVRLEKVPTRSTPITAQLGVRLPSRTTSFEIEMFDVGQEIIAEFEVHASVNKQGLAPQQGK